MATDCTSRFVRYPALSERALTGRRPNSKVRHQGRTRPRRIVSGPNIDDVLARGARRVLLHRPPSKFADIEPRTQIEIFSRKPLTTRENADKNYGSALAWPLVDGCENPDKSG